MGHPQSGHRRWGCLDLESGRPALSRRHSNRGSLSCPAAFMENSRPASPPRHSRQKLWVIPMKGLLDDGHIEPLVTRLREVAAEHADAANLAQEILKEAEYFAT